VSVLYSGHRRRRKCGERRKRDNSRRNGTEGRWRCESVINVAVARLMTHNVEKRKKMFLFQCGSQRFNFGQVVDVHSIEPQWSGLPRCFPTSDISFLCSKRFIVSRRAVRINEKRKRAGMADRGNVGTCGCGGRQSLDGKNNRIL
jgi:hypothetical protein